MRRAALFGLLLLLVPSTAAAQKICIDPGHGGSDPGAVGNGLEEADVNLNVSIRLRDLLVEDTADTAGGGSWTVYMTRDSDATVSLASRTAYANSVGANRFMSIHANAFSSSSANGTETFAYAEGGQGAALRNLVQQEMIAAWGLTNRGNKVASFYVLRESSMPAELHELGFITNAGDAAKLGSPAQRQLAAEAHLKAIQRHYGITPYIPGSAPEPPPPTEGTIEGTVTGPDGPVVGASVSLDGDHAATTGSDGSFSISGVAAGEHVIGVAAAEFLPADSIANVVGGQTTRADFTLEADGHESDPIDVPGIDGLGGDGELIDDTSASDEGGLSLDLLGGCAVGSRGSSSGALLLVIFALVAARRRRR